jgi:uncharacterized protein with HEPN domain
VEEHRRDAGLIVPCVFRVDTGIVWDVIENKVPELVQTLQALKDEDQP